MWVKVTEHGSLWRSSLIRSLPGQTHPYGSWPSCFPDMWLCQCLSPNAAERGPSPWICDNLFCSQAGGILQTSVQGCGDSSRDSSTHRATRNEALTINSEWDTSCQLSLHQSNRDCPGIKCSQNIYGDRGEAQRGDKQSPRKRTKSQHRFGPMSLVL